MVFIIFSIPDPRLAPIKSWGVIPINDPKKKFLTFTLNKAGKIFDITKNTDFSELCITSYAEIKKTKSEEITAQTIKAEGEKCSVCWKINKNGCDRHPA